LALVRQADGKLKLTSALAQPLIEQAATQHAQTRQKQRLFGTVKYAANTRDRARRVIVKAEHTDQGRNTS
jgi:hypothetical protein